VLIIRTEDAVRVAEDQDKVVTVEGMLALKCCVFQQCTMMQFQARLIDTPCCRT